MSAAVTCDRAACTTWTTVRSAAAHGFLRVTWDGASFDFCSADCLLAFFASVPPMESVPND